VDIDRQSSTPLYVQLKELIAAEIRDGTLKPGSRLHSEAELERAHHVSRITVRQALGALVQTGNLYRVPGKGTYVAAPKVAPLAAFTSFTENMAAQGLTASYRVLAAAWVDPPAAARAELALEQGEQALRLERLLLANGKPMCLQLGYYPERALGPDRDLLTAEALAATSLYRLLERRLGLRLWKAEETIEPAIANKEEVQHLGISRETPVLIVHRRSYLVSGDPIETVKLVFRGDTYRYRVDLFRDDPANGRPEGPADERIQSGSTARRDAHGGHSDD